MKQQNFHHFSLNMNQTRYQFLILPFMRYMNLQRATNNLSKKSNVLLKLNSIPYKREMSPMLTEKNTVGVRNGRQSNTSGKEFTFTERSREKSCTKVLWIYEIIGRYANGLSYRLVIPTHLKNLHDVFHFSILKPYKADKYNRNLPTITDMSKTFTDKSSLVKLSFEGEC